MKIIFVDSGTDKEYKYQDIFDVGDKFKGIFNINVDIISSKNIDSIILSKLLLLSNSDKVSSFKIDKNLVFQLENNSHIDSLINILNKLFKSDKKKIKRLVKYCGSPKKIKTKKGHIEFIHSIKFIKNQNDLVIVPYNQTIHHDYKLDEILDDTVKQIIPFKLTDDMLHIYTFNEGNNKLNEISDPKQEKIFSPIKLEKKKKIL